MIRSIISFIAMTACIAAMAAAQADCNITLVKKKREAKTSFIGSARISSKLAKQLEAYCKVEYKLMTTKQLIALEIEKHQKKLTKLKGGK